VRDLTTAPLAVNRFDIKSANAIGGIHVQMSLENPELIEILFSEAPGVPIDGKRERAIENHYFREDFRRAALEEMGQVVYPPRVIETYTNSLLENWNTVAIRGRQPRLVLDYSLSAPAFFFPTTLDKLGVETIASTPSPATVRGSRWARASRRRRPSGGDGPGHGGRHGRNPRPGG
jgi:mannose-1-phosphate guanylyltransferase/phosphomannomutase